MSVALPWSSPAFATSGTEMEHPAPYALQQLLNTIQLAAFYMPLAVAFALIQAITRRVFLSFGQITMFGSIAAAYVCFGRLVHGNSDFTAALFSLLAAMVIAAALGKASATQVFLPSMRASALSFMIAAVGFSIALEELMRLSTDSRDIWIPPLFQDLRLAVIDGDFPVYLTANSVFAVAISMTATAITAATLRFTIFGRNWRACAQNEKLAMLCGVNTSRTIQGTFMLGAALAAVSGWMTAITYGSTSFSVGTMLGFKAMFAAVVGGFGNVRGAALGAVALATLEVLWTVSFGTAYSDVGVFSVIAFILLLKPEGLGANTQYRESET